LIDYERLQGLFVARTYAELTTSHRGWIEEYLGDAKKGRQGEWTDSIAVGSKAFTEKVKSLLGSYAKGRDIIPHTTLLDTEKHNIGPENTTHGT
jgi:putative transposase